MGRGRGGLAHGWHAPGPGVMGSQGSQGGGRLPNGDGGAAAVPASHGWLGVSWHGMARGGGGGVCGCVVGGVSVYAAAGRWLIVPHLKHQEVAAGLHVAHPLVGLPLRAASKHARTPVHMRTHKHTHACTRTRTRARTHARNTQEPVKEEQNEERYHGLESGSALLFRGPPAPAMHVICRVHTPCPLHRTA